MTPHEFEIFCDNLIRETLDPVRYRITHSYRKTYEGQRSIMDFHIAERRQGGCSYVIEAKHYTAASIQREDIDHVEEYRQKCKASMAIFLVSNVTTFSENMKQYAVNLNMRILRIDIENPTPIDLGLPEF